MFFEKLYKEKFTKPNDLWLDHAEMEALRSFVLMRNENSAHVHRVM